MTELRERLKEELERLLRARDEMNVQAHLGRAEVRERWEKVENDLEHLEGKLKLLGQEARNELDEVGQAAQLLVDQIRDGYEHLKQLI